MTRHRTAVALIALTLAAGLAGCAGRDTAGKDGAATAGNDHEQQVKFAKCMRDNGFDMPDPEPPRAGGGVGAAPAVRADDPTFQPAFDKCRSLLPNGGEPQKLTPEQRAEQLKFARCMREHGITDFADPPADGGPRESRLLDPSDPAYQDKLADLQRATEQCGGPAGAVPAG